MTSPALSRAILSKKSNKKTASLHFLGRAFKLRIFSTGASSGKKIDVKKKGENQARRGPCLLVAEGLDGI